MTQSEAVLPPVVAGPLLEQRQLGAGGEL